MDSIEQISYLLFLRLLTEKDEHARDPRQEIHPHLLGQLGAIRLGQLRHADRRRPVRRGPRRHREAARAAGPVRDRTSCCSIARPSRFTTGRRCGPSSRASTTWTSRPTTATTSRATCTSTCCRKLSASGTNGQFRTPRHIIDLIVALVDPQPGQRICDPAVRHRRLPDLRLHPHSARTHTKPADLKRGHIDGALLKPAQWRFLEEQAFTGYDNDANMVKIGILNLYLHQLEKAHIELRNPLTTGFGGAYPGQRFDVILANPPFAGRGAGREHPLRPELQAEHARHRAAVSQVVHRPPGAGGRAGVIVPNGVLFGWNNAAKASARTAADRVRLASRHQSAERRVQAVLRRRHRRADLSEGKADARSSGSTT